MILQLMKAAHTINPKMLSQIKVGHLFPHHLNQTMTKSSYPYFVFPIYEEGIDLIANKTSPFIKVGVLPIAVIIFIQTDFYETVQTCSHP